MAFMPQRIWVITKAGAPVISFTSVVDADKYLEEYPGCVKTQVVLKAHF